MKRVVLLCGVPVLLIACNKEPGPSSSTPTSGTQQAQATSTPASPAPASEAPIAADAPNAEVGKAAPAFTLKDLDGKPIALASFKGKVVVLEWFNPGCPYVKKSHTKGSLKEDAKKHSKNGVVWLAINSGSSGKQGHGVETNREGAKTFNLDHPILMDESGAVGKKYGATNTPHMFVIDGQGTLVYKGAIDNSPDGEGESAPGGKLVNYVDEAVNSVTAGKPVATTETKAYGCSVKY